MSARVIGDDSSPRAGGDAPSEAAEKHSQAASGAAVQSDQIKHMRYYASAVAFTAIVGLLAMIIQNEIAWVANTTAGFGVFCPDARDLSCDPRDAAMMWPVRNEKLLLNIVRGVGVTATTALTLFYLERYYSARLEFMRAKNQLPHAATLFSTPSLRWPFLFESIVLSIHTFPGIDDAYTASPALYLSFSLLMFLRLFFLVRVIRFRSSLNSSNGRFISALTNVEFNAGFILKTALKDNPIAFMVSVLLMLLFSSAYAIRMIESLMCSFDRSLGCDPLDFWDSLWLVVITTLTVGYGDIVARTPGGRLVSVVGGMGGTIITAVTIALMTDYLQLSRSEAKVVTFLRKHNYRRMVHTSATLVIQTAYRLHKSRTGGFQADRDDAALQVLTKQAAESRKNMMRARQTTASGQSRGAGPSVGARSGAATGATPRARVAATFDTAHAAGGDADATAGKWGMLGLFASPQRTVPVSNGSPRGNAGVLMSPTTSNAVMPLAGGSPTRHNGDPLSPSAAATPVNSKPVRRAPAPLQIADTNHGADAVEVRATAVPRPRAVASQVPPPSCGSRAAHSVMQVRAWIAGSVSACVRASSASGITASHTPMFERLLFERLEQFRHTKRWVMSHDPTDPVDKQLTILETLEVNVEEMKTNMETLSEFLLGPAADAANGSAAPQTTSAASAILPSARDPVHSAASAAANALANGSGPLAAVTSRAAMAVATGDVAPLKRVASDGRMNGHATARGAAADAEVHHAVAGPVVPPLAITSPISPSNANRSAFARITPTNARRRRSAGGGDDVQALTATVSALTQQLTTTLDMLASVQAAFQEHAHASDARIVALETALARLTRRVPRGAVPSDAEPSSTTETPQRMNVHGVSTSLLPPIASAKAMSPRGAASRNLDIATDARRELDTLLTEPQREHSGPTRAASRRRMNLEGGAASTGSAALPPTVPVRAAGQPAAAGVAPQASPGPAADTNTIDAMLESARGWSLWRS